MIKEWGFSSAWCLECLFYQAVGGNGAEQTVVSGSMDVLRPCWAVATSGVPVREQLFNVSICHYSHFNLFQHGELYRSYGRGSDMASLEVATPILIPRSDGHKHRKGSHGDVIFLTNRGEVCYYFVWLPVVMLTFIQEFIWQPIKTSSLILFIKLFQITINLFWWYFEIFPIPKGITSLEEAFKLDVIFIIWSFEISDMVFLFLALAVGSNRNI